MVAYQRHGNNSSSYADSAEMLHVFCCRHPLFAECVNQHSCIHTQTYAVSTWGSEHLPAAVLLQEQCMLG